jgi:hypothetical protein
MLVRNSSIYKVLKKNVMRRENKILSWERSTTAIGLFLLLLFFERLPIIISFSYRLVFFGDENLEFIERQQLWLPICCSMLVVIIGWVRSKLVALTRSKLEISTENPDRIRTQFYYIFQRSWLDWSDLIICTTINFSILELIGVGLGVFDKSSVISLGFALPIWILNTVLHIIWYQIFITPMLKLSEPSAQTAERM